MLSESLQKEILALVEAKILSFRQAQNARELNKMMTNGRLDKVKQTSTGTLIGDADTVAKLYKMKKEFEEDKKNAKA